MTRFACQRLLNKAVCIQLRGEEEQLRFTTEDAEGTETR